MGSARASQHLQQLSPDGQPRPQSPGSPFIVAAEADFERIGNRYQTHLWSALRQKEAREESSQVRS
jgi:hypothetical protein